MAVMLPTSLFFMQASIAGLAGARYVSALIPDFIASNAISLKWTGLIIALAFAIASYALVLKNMMKATQAILLVGGFLLAASAVVVLPESRISLASIIALAFMLIGFAVMYLGFKKKI